MHTAERLVFVGVVTAVVVPITGPQTRDALAVATGKLSVVAGNILSWKNDTKLKA